MVVLILQYICDLHGPSLMKVMNTTIQAHERVEIKLFDPHHTVLLETKT